MFQPLDMTSLKRLISGGAQWDPTDQQEARKIFAEYVDVFANDNLDLGWTSIVKHNITLKEGAKPIKEH